jgi:aminobenzoyl-glutamate utilization protein B
LVCSFFVLFIGFSSMGYAADSPKDTAFGAVERNMAEIGKVGDAIWTFAELGMQEFETSKLFGQVLSDMGYTVKVGVAGFPTAVLATYGSGKPVIAIHFEYDAIPSVSQAAGVCERRPVVDGAPGHAEGHNTNAAVVAGAAYAVKEAMDRHNLKGTIKILSAPAEEQLIARPYFVRDGYFKDVDIGFHAHVSSRFQTSYGIRQYAMMSVEYTFKGKTAHAATSPEKGVSAVDAVKLMDIGWDALREHLPVTLRTHSVIKDGGIQPNVVPDTGKIWYFFRAPDYETALATYKRAAKVAEGAALMTGCSWEEKVISAVWPTRDNEIVARTMQSNIELVGMPQWTSEEQEFAKRIQKAAGVKVKGLETKPRPLKEATQSTSCNDSGDVTWSVPHGRISFPANIPGVRFHHWCAAIATAKSSIAYKGEAAGAKVLAGTIVDLMGDPSLVAKAKESFEKELAGSQHKTLLPPDQKPPVELNRAEMAKYRKLMEAHYYRPTIRFQ